MPLIILFFLSAIMPIAHDYHFGYTEVFYNPAERSLEISIKVFTDDLNAQVSKLNNADLKLDTEDELAQSDEYVAMYLRENFQLELNGKKTDYNFLGKEYEEDIVWLFVEAHPVKKKFKSLKVTNTLLFDAFDDQKHTLNVDLGNGFKSAMLQEGRSSFEITR